MLRKLLAGIPLTVVALMGGAGIAHADPPIPLDTPPPFILPGTDSAGIDGFCTFDVAGTFSEVRQHARTQQADGTVVIDIQGSAFLTLTNVSNEKSITYNVSGPGTITIYPDESFSVTAHGPNVFWTSVRNSLDGMYQIEYDTGLINFSVAPDGRTTQHSVQGESTDVCAALN